MLLSAPVSQYGVGLSYGRCGEALCAVRLPTLADDDRLRAGGALRRARGE
jgi:hypothetical protein